MREKEDRACDAVQQLKGKREDSISLRTILRPKFRGEVSDSSASLPENQDQGGCGEEWAHLPSVCPG